MFGVTFSHNMFRNYVILFGTLFDNMYINRKNDLTDNVIQTVKIPLIYGPRDKYIARTEGDQDLGKPIAVTLPMMSFQLEGVEYDSTRKVNSLSKFTSTNTTTGQKQFVYAPVPYNLYFNLYVMTKTAEDAFNIAEQILPYFNPDITRTIQGLEEPCIKYDVPIVLNNYEIQDIYEGDFREIRAIVHVFSFTMKALLFGPARDQGLIRQVEATISADYDAKTEGIMVTVTPGLLADGQPTTNSSLTISKDLILPEDNYGFIKQFSEDIS